MLILRIAYIIAREHILRLIHKVNCVARWWFVMRCEESALEQLQLGGVAGSCPPNCMET